MRSVWSAVRFLVHLSTASTLTVAFARLSRNVFGAKLINQSLYISTERATSSFQRSGLSRLTIATRPFIAIVSLVVNAEVRKLAERLVVTLDLLVRGLEVERLLHGKGLCTTVERRCRPLRDSCIVLACSRRAAHICLTLANWG